MPEHPWPKTRFTVALSFADEDRDFVEQVATCLAAKIDRDRIFYDRWYAVQLAGLAQDTTLIRIYEEMSDVVVPFLSSHFTKPFCKLEWDTIRSMALDPLNGNAVFAIKLEDCKIPGWRKNDFYINGANCTPLQIAELIQRKVNLKTADVPEPPVEKPVRELENTSIIVERTDENSIVCPRSTVLRRWVTFVASVFIILGACHLLTDIGRVIMKPYSEGPLSELPGSLMLMWFYAGFLIILGVILSNFIRFSVGFRIRLSRTCVLFEHRLQEPFTLFIRCDSIKMRPDPLWWDLAFGQIWVSDGINQICLTPMRQLTGEEWLDFQEQLKKKLVKFGIRFRTGRPPSVNFI